MIRIIIEHDYKDVYNKDRVTTHLDMKKEVWEELKKEILLKNELEQSKQYG